MIVKGYTVGLETIAPRFVSGIEWTSVAGTLHYYDPGIAADHWSSEVTLTGDKATIGYLYNDLIKEVGSVIQISASESEPFLGPQFVYSSPWGCRVQEVDPPEIQADDVWQMSVVLSAPVPSLSRYVVPMALDLKALCISSIDRRLEGAVRVGDLEQGTWGADMLNTVKSTGISVSAKRETIGAMISGLVTGTRTLSLQVSTANPEHAWLFVPGVSDATVCITTISKITPMDSSAGWWTMELELVCN